MENSDNPKKQRKPDPNKVENCIYSVPNTSNLFDVRVSKRIKGKPYFRKKRSVRFIGEARQVRNKFIQELENLKQGIIHGNLLWKDAVEEYFIFRKKEITNEQWSSKTFDVQEKCVLKHTASWNNKRIADLDQNFIHQDLISKFSHLNKSTVKSNLKYIRHVFKYHLGKTGTCLKGNPLEKIKAWGQMVPKKFGSKAAMDSAEIEKLILHLEDDDSKWSEIIRFAYFTGMRSGEIYGLKFENINIDPLNDNKFINVEQSYCFTLKDLKSTKNRKPRIVPINDSLEKIIMNRRKNANSEFIFDRDSDWEAGKAATKLREYQSFLKITKTNFHSLRSAFITQMLLAGCVPAILQEVVGHESLATTQIYLKKVQTQKNMRNLTQMLEPKRISNIVDIHQKLKETK